MYFKPEYIGNRIRMVRCNLKGERIGKMFAIFPKALRKMGKIYRVEKVTKVKHGSKFCYNCMGREIKAVR